MPYCWLFSDAPSYKGLSLHRYKIQNDMAGWLSINKDNGKILVKNEMDRESHFVVDGKYTALIAAVDNGKPCFPPVLFAVKGEQTGRGENSSVFDGTEELALERLLDSLKIQVQNYL